MDRLVLAAVALLGQPAEEALFSFLEDRIEYTRFQWMITNLRDRLILIDGSSPGSVRINPVLEEELLRDQIRPERLLAGRQLPEEISQEPGDLPWFSRTFVAVLYAFLQEERFLYTRTGTLRKKAAGALAHRFGALLSDAAGEARFRTSLTVLETLHLIDRGQSPEGVQILHDAWDDLAELPDNWVQALLWAALVAHSREHAFEIAPILIDFSRRLPRDRSFSAAELLRILRLTGTGSPLSLPRDSPAILSEAGMLLACGEEYRINPSAVEYLSMSRGRETGAGLHANMEITLSPELSFRSLLDLAAISAVRRFDVMPVLELTEERMSGARRIDREYAVETLQRITGQELPQNVVFLLERWRQRADAVRLFEGLVLRVDAETAEILESSPEFVQCIRERPAPGVFLFSTDRRPVVERVLRNNGLGVGSDGERPIAANQTAAFQQLYERYRQPTLPAHEPISFDRIPPAETHTTTSAPDDRQPRPDPEEDHLRALLDQADLPEEITRELSLRIERKLILFPDQIRADLVPNVGMEAQGLDYLGKIRIAEQAIGNGDLLEVIMRTTEGAPRRLLVSPREIKETGGDLMLRAIQHPERTPVRIRIRRASLVRRLNGTLIPRRSQDRT